MLKLRDIRKTRGEGPQRYSLVVPQLDLRPGQRLALVGPSGSGKSTLLDLLALVLSPDPGGVFECSADGPTLDVAGLWRSGRQDVLAGLRSRVMGYVLQTGGLLGFLDVQRNIGLSRSLLGLPADATVRRLAEQLEIADQLHKLPAALSVGQRQRVSIARALAHGPSIVLADEPTASLDPLNAERVMQLLVAQAEERGVCILVATHDEALARRTGLQLHPLQVQRGADGGVTATLAGGG
ncbi:ABC transporter ATP-binding protein [Pseudomonas chlororaphis]|uniref:ABC transporter ATP-binding protein n=1 Tax=Pseudomonas chlororaphis TaxID=587753 RepID=UPI001B31E35B|nr:ABC transporter ATP-binding protein [Pseudomonas chlororaphis]MBP5077272.1 ABC transporter ATP-binding protein [Pseudomonas chlororaphis]